MAIMASAGHPANERRPVAPGGGHGAEKHKRHTATGQILIEPLARRLAQYLGADWRRLRGPCRGRKSAAAIAQPKFLIMAALRHVTGRPFQAIVEAFNHTDHCLAMHACRRVNEWCAVYPAEKAQYEALCALVREILITENGND